MCYGVCRFLVVVVCFCTVVLVYDLSMADNKSLVKLTTPINEFLRNAKEQRFHKVMHMFLYHIIDFNAAQNAGTVASRFGQ